MELQTELLADDVTRVIPVGRWDIAGASAIDVRLSALSGAGRPLILDMAQVTYISSMGLRSIIMSSKAAKLKGARLVLLAPSPNVAEVLQAAGIADLIPIHNDLETARLAVTA